MAIAKRGTQAGMLGAISLFLVLAGTLGGSINRSAADELLLPAAAERTGLVEGAYRFAEPVTGRGSLDLKWRDGTGRVVERRRIPFDASNSPEVTFTLDMRRAVTMKNEIVAHLALEGSHGRDERTEAKSFVAVPPDNPWADYQIIMWQGATPAGYATLKKLGVTAGMVETDHRNETGIYVPDQLTHLADADLGFYLENIATDFYSPYHKWYDNRPVNWRFLATKQRYWNSPRDPAAFIRDPSLSDPEWLRKVEDRLTRAAQALHAYRPLYYSLGDEPGIADLSASWDFDFSSPSLAAMREWLKSGYGSLAALNRQWGTAFGRWEEVVPMTTDEAIHRSDGYFSAWGDFKEWMDVAFARALKSGSDAVHAADPNAIAAIEGGQIPGWGGYDYSRLARSVDAIELYDFGDNVELARSFNPELILLTTSSREGPFEAHRVWRELLRGTRGLILWDDKNQFVDQDGRLGDRGRDAAGYFAALRGGLGALLINSRRHIDPVGILYSPASWRVQWLLDRSAGGQDWSRRDASAEYEDDAVRASTRNFAHALRHLGLQYRFISSAEAGEPEFLAKNCRVLILPHVIALAPREAEQIREFVAAGGVVIADGEPGLFDEHGGRAGQPLLGQLFEGPPSRSAVNFVFGKGKGIYLPMTNGRQSDGVRRLSEILYAAGMRAPFPLTRPDGRVPDDIETSVFVNGALTILALQRDYDPATKPESGEAVIVALPGERNVYDLRARRGLGRTDRLAVELGPVGLALLALSERPIAPPRMSGPQRLHRGENAVFSIHSDAPAARSIVHVDVIDPEGEVVTPYSGNLQLAGEATAKLVPLALNDKAGVWGIRVREVLTGETTTAELRVEP